MNSSLGSPIRLIALDFGTTTSKAIEAAAVLSRNAVTRRAEIRSVTTVRRSEPIFTPYIGERIDEARIAKMVNQWLSHSSVDTATEQIVGGVIITGLAAKKENAGAIASTVRARLGGAVVAVADDPCQESWLAFMGSCSRLSGFHSERVFVNLDIGGGTTNLAIGVNSSVLSTGSLWIGARHFRFQPGTYRIQEVSAIARRILDYLRLDVKEGDFLDEAARAKVLKFYIDHLVGRARMPRSKLTPRWIDQAPLHWPEFKLALDPVVTYSGGVGELVYRLSAGEDFGVTPFGDLGVDLARAIVDSPRLSRDLRRFQPENLGRATVCGLAFHGTEVSGSTVYLPNKSVLPLRDVPLIGRISVATRQEELNGLLARGKSNEVGISLIADLGMDLSSLQRLAARVSRALRKNRFSERTPLIIFTPQNLGKTFGQYVSGWGRLNLNLVVIDEIDVLLFGQKAYLASVTDAGGAHLLVSFYGGLGETEENGYAQHNGRAKDQSSKA